MPLPKPQADETQEVFIARCMKDPATQDITGDSEDQTHQMRVAACFRQWREKAAGAEVKAFTAKIKDAEKGEVEAVIATFNVVDKDGDYTLPGAFKDGQEVVISAYGHASWMGQLPVGKGVIRPTATEARLHGQFFLDTQAGREHFAVIRNLGPKGQWSYGYDVLETGALTEELQALGVHRVLKSLDVHEASPVLLGAGVDTRTVATKTSLKADEPAAALPLHTDRGYSDAAWDGPAQEATMDAAKLRVSCLAFVAGDPEAKTNYQLLYRDGEGRVNSNAVRTIQARLAQTDLPAGIRADVEQHAAQLLALVQAHDEAGKQLRQEIDAGLQTFERTQRQFGG